MDSITPQRIAFIARHVTISQGEAWGICPHCEKFTRRLAFRRRGCAYPDERSNWLLSCPACHDDDLAYWNDMWDEYYSGVM